MNSSFAALYCIYHDDIWLEHSVRSIYASVGGIFFFLNTRPWHGENTDNRETIECLNRLADPDNKIRIIQDTWADEAGERNYAAAVAQLSGFTYGMIVDADEIYDRAALDAMIAHAAADPDVNVWHMEWDIYWKSLEFVIDPPEPYHPPVFIRLGTCGFVEARNPSGAKHSLIPRAVGFCHHMSYARTDKLIKRKLASFSHATQILPGWFEHVWQAWDGNHELENLHPVQPTQYRRAIPRPPTQLPEAVRDLASRNPSFPQGTDR
ncbi:MAG: hypothetical protein U0136_10795 [Bdellovibrionota bacterium]